MNFSAATGLFAQTTQRTEPAWTSFVPLVLMVVVFYFLLIRPQQKKAKEHENVLKSLRRGDKVVFAGGIVGEVTLVKEKHVNVRSGESKFEILKSAVTEVTERGSEAPAA
jgi:preprotein translocase subunit YajC